MSDFVGLRALPQPRRISDLSLEARHFKAFKALPIKSTVNTPTAAVAWSPTAPHRLLVTSSLQVDTWKVTGNEAVGSLGMERVAGLTKFKDRTTCLSWRSDGRLWLAGEAGGSLAMVEPDTRGVHRRFRGHGDVVTCASFSPADRTQVVSGCRDGRLRLWDVIAGEMLGSPLEAHVDSITCLSPGPSGPSSWVTAGMDGKVKLWDIRVPSSSQGEEGQGPCVATVDHEQPVETGVAFPGAMHFISAGGRELRFWDLLSGRLQKALPNLHLKAIKAVCLDSAAAVLVSAGLDGMVKLHRAADFEHLYTYQTDQGIWSMSWRHDDRAFAVGFQDGGVQVRLHRVSQTTLDQGVTMKAAGETEGDISHLLEFKQQRPKPSRWNDFIPESSDVVISSELPARKKIKRELTIDFFMRKFEYRKAVEWSVQPSVAAEQGLAVVEELLHQGALKKSLSDLSEELCCAILKWMMRAFGVGDTYQSQLVFEALHTLLDSNRCLQPPSTPELLDLVTRLELKVGQEMNVQEALIETSGMIHAVMNL